MFALTEFDCYSHKVNIYLTKSPGKLNIIGFTKFPIFSFRTNWFLLKSKKEIYSVCPVNYKDEDKKGFYCLFSLENT